MSFDGKCILDGLIRESFPPQYFQHRNDIHIFVLPKTRVTKQSEQCGLLHSGGQAGSHLSQRK